EGVDGTTAWRTDPTTGVVRPLADHDLEQALASAWFEFERWAEPGQGGGDVQLAGHEKDSLGAVTVLVVTPPAFGSTPPDAKLPRSRTLRFRDATGLLVRMDARDDQREIVSTFSDYRLAAGRVRAFVNETGVVSMPANKLRAITDSVLANVPVAGIPF